MSENFLRNNVLNDSIADLLFSPLHHYDRSINYGRPFPPDPFIDLKPGHQLLSMKYFINHSVHATYDANIGLVHKAYSWNWQHFIHQCI